MEKNNKGKITCKQAMFLILTLIYPTTLLWYPFSFAQEVKQATWLIPIPSILIFLYLIKQLNYLIVEYPNLSLLESIEKATNKFIGKLYGILIVIYLLNYISELVRYRVELMRLSVFPNVQSDIFIIPILIIVGLILNHGMVIMARINQIFFVILTFVFIIIFLLLIPNISIEKITPITLDVILPVIKSSLNVVDYLGPPLIIIFILGDKITKKNKDFMKYGKQISFMYFIFSTLIFMGSMGNFGHNFLSNTSSFSTTISKKLTIISIFTGFDSLIITILIITEAIVLSLLIFSLLRTLKYLFNIKHYNLYINIILIFSYVYSKLFAKNIELYSEFYSLYLMPIQHTVFILPIIFVWIYRIKLRRKKTD